MIVLLTELKECGRGSWGKVLRRTGGQAHWTEYVLVQFVHVLASYNLKYYTEFIFPRPGYLKYFLTLKTDVTDVMHLCAI